MSGNSSAKNGSEDNFEVLDVSELTNRQWLEKAIKDLSKKSVAQQVAVGGVTGWCAGYMCGKVSKAAAVAVGGTLICLQIASHKGYITVNWGKLEKNVKKIKKDIQTDAQQKLPAVMEDVAEFVKENAFLAGGFAGGFLIGMAS